MPQDDSLSVDDELTLARLQPSDAAGLYALIDANRAYLRRWLPWLDGTRSNADVAGFIAATLEQHAQGRGPQFKIVCRDRVVGATGFHPLDLAHGIGEIGYWLCEDRQGRGVVTRCCAALIRLGFEGYGLNRIQIPAAVDNAKSRAVPERLGFTFEGVIRQRERLYDRHVDHAMYSLLNEEYAA